MDYNRYQQLASRTAKDFGTRNNNLLYYALGLCGEAAEVADAVWRVKDPEAVVKEIGDTCWYVAHLSVLVSIQMEEVAAVAENQRFEPFDEVTRDLCIRAGTVGEIIKKIVRDDRPIDQDVLLGKLARVYGALRMISDLIGVSMVTIMEQNIKKLEARYPNGFSAQDAIARKDGERLNE